MKYRLAYLFCILTSASFLVTSCDSTETQTFPEITLELLEYFGPSGSDLDPVNGDSLFLDEYSKTAVITRISQSVDNVVDLSNFPQRSYLVNRWSHGGGLYRADIPEKFQGSVFLFFDRRVDMRYRTPRVTPIGSASNFPSAPNEADEDSVEMKVYAFVLQRPEQDYPETIEIKWIRDDVPDSLIIKPYEHFIPLDKIVRYQNPEYKSRFERGGLLGKFRSEYADSTISPVLIIGSHGVWQGGELVSRDRIQWTVGTRRPNSKPGQEYGGFFAGFAQILPESEISYFLIKRPLFAENDMEVAR